MCVRNSGRNRGFVRADAKYVIRDVSTKLNLETTGLQVAPWLCAYFSLALVKYSTNRKRRLVPMLPTVIRTKGDLHAYSNKLAFLNKISKIQHYDCVKQAGCS